jgi:predicted Fe-Mo cluster-binding NifX family protein
MKIAVSAAAPDLDAEVEPRFGRCQYFVIVDPQSMEFEGLENSGAMAAGGAGISTAQMIADKGVEVVLTGNCGPNAYRTLSAAGVQVVTGVSGRIRDAVEAYRAGKLKPNAQPSVESHYGMGMGSGTAGGMGRGMGAGMTPPAASQPMSPEQEMEALKSQTRMMMEQLGQIQSRITELEKKS